MESNLIDKLLPDNTYPNIRISVDRFLQREKFWQFAKKNSSKISAKFKNAPKVDDQWDIHAELEFAFLVINHIIGIQYEQNASKKRAPDFRLQIDKNSYIGAEVRRIRYDPKDIEQLDELEGKIKYKKNESFKFTYIIFEKLGQLEPNIPNIIYIRSKRLIHEALDASHALVEIRSRFRGGDLEFIASKSNGVYKTLGDFADSYARLSAIVVRDDWTPSSAKTNTLENSVFLNEESKFPLTADFILKLKEMS